MPTEAEFQRPKRMCAIYFPYGASVPGDDHADRDWGWFPVRECHNFRYTNVMESRVPHRHYVSGIGGLSHPTAAEGKLGTDDANVSGRLGHVETENYADNNGAGLGVTGTAAEGETNVDLGDAGDVKVVGKAGTATVHSTVDSDGNSDVAIGASVVEGSVSHTSDAGRARVGGSAGVGLGFRTHNNEDGIGLGADVGFFSFDLQVKPEFAEQAYSTVGMGLVTGSYWVGSGVESAWDSTFGSL
jgi:hypothetical protein